MKLKRRLWLCYIRFFTFLFKRKKLEHTVHFNFSATPEASHAEAIDIVTVAFNNETWIEYQIKLIRKYIHDKHVTFIVADNSSNPEKRKSISALCRKYNTGYISVPKNMIAKHPGGSYAHGTTLNWIYSNVIRLRKPDIFGFLDHDLFPIAPVSIREKLGDKDFYGSPRGEVYWWLWAGLCFFRFDKVKALPLDFIPYIEHKTYLDTGGANYPILYKNYNLPELRLPLPQNIRITAGNKYHSDYIQIIDDCWLHAINGSNWNGISPREQETKEDILKARLEQFIQA